MILERVHPAPWMCPTATRQLVNPIPRQESDVQFDPPLATVAPSEAPSRTSRSTNWRIAWAFGSGPEGPSQHHPSKRPVLPDPLMGRYNTNKSSQGRADAQRLVATRLLDRLHDPLGHFSRLQRIYPRAR